MTFTKTLNISKKDADLFNTLLDVEAEENGVEKMNYPTDSTLLCYTVHFDDGFEADVRLCSGQTNFWAEVVLYDEMCFEYDDLIFDHIADGDVLGFNCDRRLCRYRIIINII